LPVSEYFLTGLGGIERSREHAINSARALNAFSPEFIRIRTLIPAKGTPLYEDYKAGNFKLLSAHQALKEVRLFVEHLECENSMLLSDHINNYWNVHGLLPRDREKMLASIDHALTIPESEFRPPHLGSF
jgi:radical SAM superfamily enzyme